MSQLQCPSEEDYYPWVGVLNPNLENTWKKTMESSVTTKKDLEKFERIRKLTSLNGKLKKLQKEINGTFTVLIDSQSLLPKEQNIDVKGLLVTLDEMGAVVSRMRYGVLSVIGKDEEENTTQPEE